MFQRSDGDAQIWPTSRPCSPPAIGTSRDLPTPETALSSVHMSDTIDSSKGQCTETSHAGAWIEETRREACNRRVRKSYETRCSRSLTMLDQDTFGQNNNSKYLLTDSFERRTTTRPLSVFNPSPLYARHLERHRKARALLQHATLRSLSIHRLRLKSTCGGRFDDLFALMVLRLLLICISKPYIKPKFRQETQRTVLWRRCAINDLVWSSYAPPGVSTPVQQQDSVWRRRTPPRLH
jgi:hypothetical protein